MDFEKLYILYEWSSDEVLLVSYNIDDLFIDLGKIAYNGTRSLDDIQIIEVELPSKEVEDEY